MQKLTFTDTKDYETLAAMARDSWHSAYDLLLGAAQVDYMLNKFQSAAALKVQTERQGYTYYFLSLGEERVGYCGLQDQKQDLFLSKVYLGEEYRSRGLGQEALAFAVAEGKRRGKKRVYLTVNKHNARAIRAYEKFGFIREGEECAAIGEGYYMDDYIYGYRL